MPARTSGSYACICRVMCLTSLRQHAVTRTILLYVREPTSNSPTLVIVAPVSVVYLRASGISPMKRHRDPPSSPSGSEKSHGFLRLAQDFHLAGLTDARRPCPCPSQGRVSSAWECPRFPSLPSSQPLSLPWPLPSPPSSSETGPGGRFAAHAFRIKSSWRLSKGRLVSNVKLPPHAPPTHTRSNLNKMSI